MSDGLIVCFSKCWPCNFAEHRDPPEPHTWMDEEDAEFHGHPWPLPPEVEAKNQCGCWCVTPPERADQLAAENQALREQITTAVRSLTLPKESKA
jgi:hypothetical protein